MKKRLSIQEQCGYFDPWKTQLRMNLEKPREKLRRAQANVNMLRLLNQNNFKQKTKENTVRKIKQN